MATLLYRLGRASFRRRKLVVVLWLVLLAALGGSALAFKGATSSDFTMPGTESQRAIDALRHEFPEASGATGTIVVAAPQGGTLADPQLRTAVQGLAKEAATLPGAVGAVDPFTAKALSQDGRYGLIQVQFAGRADDITEAQRTAYENSGAAAEAAGLRVEHGGEVMNGEPEVGGTEAIGVVIALVVLLVTFGSLVAAGMTMLNALIGVGAGMAGLYALSSVVSLTNFIFRNSTLQQPTSQWSLLNKNHAQLRICDTRVVDGSWAEKHWNSIRHAYNRAACFARRASGLEARWTLKQVQGDGVG